MKTFAHLGKGSEPGWTPEQAEYVKRVAVDRGFRTVELHRQRHGGVQRMLLAGEAHIKPRAHARRGRELVAQFDTRLVEGFPRSDRLTRICGYAIQAPRVLVRYLTLGLLQDSTIATARNWPTGQTLKLEPADRFPLTAKIGVVWVAAVSGLWTLGFLGQVLLSAAGALSDERARMLLAIYRFVAIVVAAQFVAYAFLRRTKTVSPAKALLSPMLGVNQVRSRLMVDTVTEYFDRGDIDTALVIVGRAHVNEMVALLQAAGWAEPPVLELVGHAPPVAGPERSNS